MVDDLTLELPMNTPYATFVDQICNNYYFGIVPEGYDPAKPIGTGPFKFESFTPGEQSVFVRNPDYFKTDLPYLDELTIIDSFGDATAALNALKSGTVDVFENAPPELSNQVASDTQPSHPDLGSGPLGAVHDEHERASVRRREGASGVPPDDRPRADARLLGCRPGRRRQRRLRPA